MINASAITAHVLSWLQQDANLSGFAFTRGEFVNEDPGAAVNGWIGIYRRSVMYDPRNLGVPSNNFAATLIFDVVVQRTNLKSGADAEDALEASTKHVLDRLVSIPKDYIYFYKDLRVDYAYIETDRRTMYFQGALITATAELLVEVE